MHNIMQAWVEGGIGSTPNTIREARKGEMSATEREAAIKQPIAGLGTAQCASKRTNVSKHRSSSHYIYTVTYMHMNVIIGITTH